MIPQRPAYRPKVRWRSPIVQLHVIAHAELLSGFMAFDICTFLFHGFLFLRPSNHRDIWHAALRRRLFAKSVTCYIGSSPCGPLTHLEMDCCCDIWTFGPRGETKTKSLSRAINGCAPVCLLIAPSEAQWDPFTVDGADNGVVGGGGCGG